MNTDPQTLTPILVNAKGAARLLSISRSAFYSKLSAGLIPPAVYIGESPRWPVETLRVWVESGCLPAEQFAAMRGQR